MWAKTLKDAALAMTNTFKKTAGAVPPPQNVAPGIAQYADDATTALGRKLRNIGRTMSQHDAAIGVGSAASFAAAHGLEKAGKYLEVEGLDGAISDLGEQVKKNPLPFIAIGVGLGFLVGRLLAPRRG